MTLPEPDSWIPCDVPATGDILRWAEPIWAAPDKPRGKRDQAGEQRVTARFDGGDGVFELDVLHVEPVAGDATLITVKTGDRIRRKAGSLFQGGCEKLESPSAAS